MSTTYIDFSVVDATEIYEGARHMKAANSFSTVTYNDF